METYIIVDDVYYYRDKYQHIFTVDRVPKGPLNKITKMTYTMKRSEFQANENNCVLALYHPIHRNRLLKQSEKAVLLTFLEQNKYTIDTELAKLLESFLVIKWIAE